MQRRLEKFYKVNIGNYSSIDGVDYMQNERLKVCTAGQTPYGTVRRRESQTKPFLVLLVWMVPVMHV